MLTIPLLQRVNDQVKIITVFLAALNGIIGFLGGIVMLGSWFFPMIPFFPSILMNGHPYLVLLGFFTTFIIFERWIGLQVVKDRPQSLLDIIIIITDLGALLLLASYLFQIITNNSLPMAFLSALILYFLAGILMVMVQAWAFRSLPQFRTEAIFLMIGFSILGIILGTVIVSQIFNGISFARQLTYLPTFLVLVVLGERITFARIGMAGKLVDSSKKEPYYIILGVAFIVGILIDMILGINEIALLNFVILGSLTILIMLDDTGRKKSPLGTKFHDFQRWTLQGAYSWLIVGVVLLAWAMLSPSLLLYDAGLHSITLGFIITMLLAHAPTVLPTIFGRPAIANLPKGLAFVVIFWVLTGFRIVGDIFQLFLTDIPFRAIIALSGYLSIVPITAYVFTLLTQIKSVRKETIIPIR